MARDPYVKLAVGAYNNDPTGTSGLGAGSACRRAIHGAVAPIIPKLAKAPTAPVGVSNNDHTGTSGLGAGSAWPWRGSTYHPQARNGANGAGGCW